MPSTTKNAISTSVSDTDPLIGQSSRTTPAAIAMIAEISDHQKPGAPRAMKVVIRPITPLIRKIQPMMMVKASVAIGGSTIAATPRMSRTMPSIKNMTQCWWIAPATACPSRSAPC